MNRAPSNMYQDGAHRLDGLVFKARMPGLSVTRGVLEVFWREM